MTVFSKRNYIFLLLFLFHKIDSTFFPRASTVEQLKIGNFALPSSQQPGPLIGFGQNMLGEKEIQLFNFVNYLKGCNREFTTVTPTLLYGFTENFSMYIQLPTAAKFKENQTVSRGIQEALIQFEYSFFNDTTPTITNQASIVSYIALSPDQQDKDLRKGNAITNYFVGFTASHMGTHWYPFISVGGIIATRDDSKTKYGNQLLYECGLSRNIWYKEDTYILNWMIELDGFYKKKDVVCGILDPNSESNTILLGPSIWFSTQHFSIQFGLSGVIYQKLSGIQNKNTYYFSLDCGYKF